MLSILCSCIDEMDEINQDMLDIILLPLIPTAKVENPAVYKLAGALLRRISTHVEKPLSSFINNALIGDGSDAETKDSDLAEHLYAVIYELHKISPSVLTEVIPNICAQLRVEDEQLRTKAVQLLGRLFTSPHADYAKEFPRNFREYLGRFNDLALGIRLEMVESCSVIMKKKPELRPSVEGMAPSSAYMTHCVCMCVCVCFPMLLHTMRLFLTCMCVVLCVLECLSKRLHEH
jgi:sister-chromatid-cohesion protein PDS5